MTAKMTADAAGAKLAACLLEVCDEYDPLEALEALQHLVIPMVFEDVCLQMEVCPTHIRDLAICYDDDDPDCRDFRAELDKRPAMEDAGLAFVSIVDRASTRAIRGREVEILDARPTDEFYRGLNEQVDRGAIAGWQVREGYVNGGDSRVVYER